MSSRAATLTGFAAIALWLLLALFTAASGEIPPFPPAEAGLIAYLWPLLIVLFSGLLPGERLRAAHVAGALLGLMGVIVLVLGRSGLALEARHAPGYLLAVACAFVWSGYSVLSRRFSAVPTDAVAAFCLVTAVLSLLCHLFLETTVWPRTGMEWLAV